MRQSLTEIQVLVKLFSESFKALVVRVETAIEKTEERHNRKMASLKQEIADLKTTQQKPPLSPEVFSDDNSTSTNDDQPSHTVKTTKKRKVQ